MALTKDAFLELLRSLNTAYNYFYMANAWHDRGDGWSENRDLILFWHEANDRLTLLLFNADTPYDEEITAMHPPYLVPEDTIVFEGPEATERFLVILSVHNRMYYEKHSLELFAVLSQAA